MESFVKASREWSCESCGEVIPIGADLYARPDGKPGWLCSSDCYLDFEEALLINDDEDRRQYELFGDDLDSWYR